MVSPRAPALPGDRLGLLTWNLNGTEDARKALCAQLAKPECPWSVVLAQEWVPYDEKVGFTADVVTAHLQPHCGTDWTVASITTSTKGTRRSALLVRTAHPHRGPKWPVKLELAGDSATTCWAKVRWNGPSGFSMIVINIHGTSHKSTSGEAERARMMQTTLKQIDEAAGRATTGGVVVGGDWNAEPWDPEMLWLAQLGAARDPRATQRNRSEGRPRLYFSPGWRLAAHDGTSDPAGTYFWGRERGQADRWRLYDHFVLDRTATARWLLRGTTRLVPELSGHQQADRRGKPTGAPLSDHVPVSLIFR